VGKEYAVISIVDFHASVPLEFVEGGYEVAKKIVKDMVSEFGDIEYPGFAPGCYEYEIQLFEDGMPQSRYQYFKVKGKWMIMFDGPWNQRSYKDIWREHKEKMNNEDPTDK